MSKSECDELAATIEEAAGVLSDALAGVKELAEMYMAHGGDSGALQGMLNVNTLAGAGLSIASTAEMFRMAGTETIVRYTPNGVRLETPGSARRFLPWINPNGRFVAGVRAGGTITGVIGTGASYAFAIDSFIEEDYASAAEYGFDGTVGVVGLTASNPWTAAFAGAYLGGKGIGTYFGQRAVRNLVKDQLPGAQFAVELGARTLNDMRARYERHCR